MQIFRDYGYRRLRNKARLKFLLADWGPEKFREVLETEYLGYALPDGPPAPAVRPRRPRGRAQAEGRAQLRRGRAVRRARVRHDLANVADLAESVGSHRVRLTPHQKLLVLDVPDEHVEHVVSTLKENGLDARPSPFRRSTIACTGIEYCKLAIVDTKDTATATIDELEQRLGDLSQMKPLSLHVNGCPNSCARIQTADIGLKGQLVMDDDGQQVPGFQVHLGGGLASDDREVAGMGRTVRGLKVTADDLTDYVERVVRRYESDKDGSETFAEWAHRADEEALR